ncbi:hypothetical protein Btru_015046 [Bulinus truncatus]|nr:hypothetical protein Btru_015046 [Bulinus truncatus]
MNSEDDDMKYGEGEDSGSAYIVQLPEVALVTILQYLTLKERYYMSQTCHLFHQLFSHPRLWRFAHINLVSQIRTKCEEEIKYCTWDLNKASQLESLTLRIFTFSRPQYIKPSALKDLYLINGLIRNAVCLKHLCIIAWPFALEAGDEDKIIPTLLNNPNIVNLQTLQLFFMSASDGPWAKKISPLPSPEMTLKIVSHFKNLNCLALRSSMLSYALFKELSVSSRNPLRSFKILIVYSNDPQLSNVPDIPPSAWYTLIKACPHLRVEYIITARTPLSHLEYLFNPHVPLVSLTVLEYGKCDRALLELLTSLYSASLESLVIFCDSWNCDRVLISLVESCVNLKCLIFCGDLASRTVVNIAEMINRQRRVFTTFKFKGKNIKTEPFIEEDTVITKNSENEYIIVPVRMWHFDQEHINIRLRELAQTVYDLTGCYCLVQD